MAVYSYTSSNQYERKVLSMGLATLHYLDILICTFFIWEIIVFLPCVCFEALADAMPRSTGLGTICIIPNPIAEKNNG